MGTTWLLGALLLTAPALHKTLASTAGNRASLLPKAEEANQRLKPGQPRHYDQDRQGRRQRQGKQYLPQALGLCWRA